MVGQSTHNDTSDRLDETPPQHVQTFLSHAMVCQSIHNDASDRLDDQTHDQANDQATDQPRQKSSDRLAVEVKGRIKFKHAESKKAKNAHRCSESL